MVCTTYLISRTTRTAHLLSILKALKMPVRDVALGALSGALVSVFVSQLVLPRLRTRQLRSQAVHGTVFLVGAGPGDPELLTLKARRLLASATVVVVDDLVGAKVYALIPKDCEIIYVGKRGGKKDSAKQVDIDAILVDKCRGGHIVVRLKGGDPMVFGRVHSEIRALVRAQCKFEVIPGISSALAVPATANIPVTHKTLSTNFVVISGHKPAEMDFVMLAKVETIVLLMATRTIGSICESLVENGKDKDTPVALIHSGTNPDQVLLLGILEDIAAKTEGKKYSPAIIVIGEVAKYGDLKAYLDESDDDPINTDV